MAPPDTTDPNKVRTHVFYGNSQRTIDTIPVGMPGSSLYPDGQPKGDPEIPDNNGDGTVRQDSATLPCNEGQRWASCDGHNYIVDEEHASLIKKAAQDIANTLYPSTSSSVVKSAVKSQVLSEAAAASQFSLSIDGRARVLVTDPTGKQIGVNPATGLIVNTMTDADMLADAQGMSIAINTPVDGVYTVEMKSLYDEDNRIILSYIDYTRKESARESLFNTVGTKSFQFTLNSAATPVMTITYAPYAPAGLQADPTSTGDLQTRLTWPASTSGDVTGYRIYSRLTDEPFLTLLGTSTGLFFDTGHSWAATADIPAHLYAVAAVNSSGTESFLSIMAINNDRDHDGLTDEEETALGTNMTLSDTDSDGLNDGEERNYGTNPLLSDTDGDGYSDYAEVKAGSDPLDSQSIPSMPLYASFTGQGIWKWNGSAWSQTTPNNPELMVTSGTTLYGSFTGQGIWKYDGSAWTQTTPNNPELMVTSGTTLYGSFTGGGIWKWDGSGWTQATPNNPQSMVMLGTDLYGTFMGAGIWKWDGSTWSQATPNTPDLMVATATTLYGSFAGGGIWKLEGSIWSQATPNNPQLLVASGENLYGSFAGAGIWKWDGSSWTQTTPNNPQQMVSSATELYGAFTGGGIWKWDGSTWTQVTPNTPTIMVVGN